MNKIKTTIENREGPLLNIYFTAGYPELNSTSEIIESLDRHGTDLIEIGMPYSDPMADGPVIQKSSAKAIRNGLTLKKLFEQIRSVSSRVSAPMILMGYLNQMMQYGEERFLETAVSSGIRGLIIPDLPPELYEEQYREMFQDRGMEIIFLVTPQTSEQRIRYIDRISDSFLYAVSDSSITGGTSAISEAQVAYFRRLRDLDLKNPFMVGFGISDHTSFRQVTEEAPGAIVGSAFIKTLEKAVGKEDLDLTIRDFIRRIKLGEEG